MMSYKIQEIDGYVEVSVWGETSKWEVLEIIRELQRRDPCKKVSDLWIVSGECMVPFTELSEIADAVKSLCTPNMIGSKSAVVAANELQRMQLEMYRAEAAMLPFEIGVFKSREDAVQWLKSS
jgi:hypothetical protein